MYKFNIYTIGVYGSSEDSFFKALVDAQIDTFCDIRQRRGVRGSQYSYVNSNYLQSKLKKLGISYNYTKELAPTNEIRQKQKEDDKTNKIDKKSRTELGLIFKLEYTKQILDTFNFDNLLKELEGMNAHNVVFFCVEKNAKACHRSLVAARISKKYNLNVTHL